MKCDCIMLERILLKNPENRKEFFELKKHLRSTQELKGVDPLSLWRSLNRLRGELQIPRTTPIMEVLRLFRKIEEIREVFDLPAVSYNILNELYVEIATVRDMINLPEDTPLLELLKKVKPDQLPLLGIGKDSLFEKLLQIHRYK